MKMTLTLDAKKILLYAKNIADKKKDTTFLVDFTKDKDRNYYIKACDKMEDRALFEQIDCVIDDLNKSDDTDKYSYYEDVKFADEYQICTAIIFLDLSASFSGNAKKLIDALFLNGLDIKYADDRTVHYIPFDKSSSMSRNSGISFLAENLFDSLNKRLTLDAELPEVTISKFYAYKGLFLSSGKRVDHAKHTFGNKVDALLLNEETVVIIPDEQYVHKFKKDEIKEVFTAEKSESIDGKRGAVWESSVKDKDKMKIDVLYDGEGLICDEYAQNISVKMGYSEDEATSFQIRMPYTKGMLHRVNFHGFIEEMLAKYDDSDAPWCIKDICGRERDLRKAKIIMPRSMFKWASLIGIKNDNSRDYVKEYFDKFKEYNHGLYVTGTNMMLKAKNRIHLNYQFLNTLSLTDAETKALVDYSLDYAKSPDKYLKEVAALSRVDEECDAEDIAEDANSNDAELDGDASIKSLHKEAWLAALEKNDLFKHDTYIKNKLTGIGEQIITDCGFGRLIVEGEMRYLSRDLLWMLSGIVLRIMENDNRETEKISRFEKDMLKECLFTDQFYMPQNNVYLNKQRYYAMLRNPHLSKNEQVLAKPIYPEAEDNLYKRYFSHLSGLIMVAKDSLAPMTLGGADFDGDMVKITGNANIVKAIKRGAYKQKNNQLWRNLPLIEIPSLSGERVNVEPTNSTQYLKLIKNTFSNKIGQISNSAIRLGQYQYANKSGESEQEQFKPQYDCALFTILTGLEIDAAKTGEHPNMTDILKYCHNGIGEDIESKKNHVSVPEVYNYIDDFKTVIDRLISKNYYFRVGKEDAKWYPLKKTETEDSGMKFELKKAKYMSDLIIDYTYKENRDILSQLPYYYFDNICNYKLEMGEKQSHYVLFGFMKSRNWRKNLFVNENKADNADTKKKDNYAAIRSDIAGVIKAYKEIEKANSAVYKRQNAVSDNSYSGYINTILWAQYDNSVYDDICYTVGEDYRDIIKDLLNSEGEAQAAIERCKTEGWAFQYSLEDKKNTLRKILNTDAVDLDYFSYLYNFNNNGYMLLYYLLLQIKNDFVATRDYKSWFDEILNENTEETKFKEYSEETYNDTRSALKKTITESEEAIISSRDRKALWMNKCKEKINTLYGKYGCYSKEDKVAIMYSLTGNNQIDTTSKFFWEYYNNNIDLLLGLIAQNEEAGK